MRLLHENEIKDVNGGVFDDIYDAAYNAAYTAVSTIKEAAGNAIDAVQNAVDPAQSAPATVGDFPSSSTSSA